ncbi:response regulator transcription factor [Telmatospirillum sp. J64-1]|uniref:response regulator transcription factor n=1 Tax=Telmatospirillum sp. J64-1 TaxID=2502183 RepID=UPI00115E3E68|nr:response regulator transcription factor [Telmatospirillum sp. J64-1]
MTGETRSKGRILLVEDEETVRDLHGAVLLSAGFETESAATLAELRRRIGSRRFDLVLLDLRLPDGNALDAVAEIRQTTSAGIIIATSSQDQKDRLEGLESGADEYLEKPVHPRELLARVNNLLGRLRDAGAVQGQSMVYRFEGWTVDLLARKVQFHAGGDVSLTENEFRLLEALIRNNGKPVHRDRLLSLWDDNEDITARAIDKAVYRMRLKLHAGLGQAAPLIETVHGYGYSFIARPL